MNFKEVICCIYLYFKINQVNMTAIVFPGRGVNMSIWQWILLKTLMCIACIRGNRGYFGIDIRKIININPNNDLNKLFLLRYQFSLLLWQFIKL